MRPRTYKSNGPSFISAALKIAMSSVIKHHPEMRVDRALARAKTAEILGLLLTMDALGMLPNAPDKADELSEALSLAVTFSHALDEVRSIGSMQISHLLPVSEDLDTWSKDIATMVKSVLEKEEPSDPKKNWA